MIDFSDISACLANSCIPEPSPRSNEPANLANSIPEARASNIFFNADIVGSWSPLNVALELLPKFA